jgi:ribosomal protein L37AE/L43A
LQEIPVDGRCAICDADDIQGRNRVMRGKRARVTYCHACGRRLSRRLTVAIWIFSACAFLLLMALLTIYGLR